jgi:hypothetical protein
LVVVATVADRASGKAGEGEAEERVRLARASGSHALKRPAEW